MRTSVIFKILTADAWAAARSGADIAAPVDLADGYVHFSTAGQVQDTLDKWFEGADDLMLIAFSSRSFGDALKWEPSRGGDLFPHVYGSVRADQALHVWRLSARPEAAPLAPREALEFQLP